VPLAVRNAVRLLLLSVAAAALLTLLVTPAATRGPYMSALSDLAVSPVYAKGCPDRFCNRNVSCRSGAGSSCKKVGTSGCETIPCV
jgi:hypothetical protein